ncbi:TIGR03086 family metal-binding protein [Pseudarthrobacter sp. fls2-241-R2A-168]|uniref:TIGR03086 family metal-binding protein n=1 Tax=Pseudarthrobacter sp. fls2-241-R2A-168 TaxID=3040304 RepID=UPI00255273BB|nr:TIGR03086 family metal-binding protein [Pseudarthrobacter sp. fls2-241-R2A-168]
MSFDKTIHLPVTADEAFALVTEPERLRRWQTVAARVDLRIAGDFRWTVTPGHNAAGTFKEIEPGKRVVFTWGWEGGGDLPPGASTVTITLEPEANGTSLRLVHEGLTEEQAASHAMGWNHYLDRLVAETTSDGGAGPDDWAWAPDPIDYLSSADAALAILLGVLRNVTPADSDKATPCEDFNVAQLLDHLAGSLQNIGRALGADPADVKEAAPETRIAELAQPTVEAFTRRGVEGNVDMGFAELPATMVAGILNLELLVHAWDFATATGQHVAVSDVVSDFVTELAQQTISEQVRSSGSFAPAQPTAETASSLERLLAFTGRNVTL